MAAGNVGGNQLPKRTGPEDFKLLRMIGRGDVGKVYLVQRRDSEEYYAMKILQKQEMIKRKKVKRALTEREILSTADHPFIVTLYSSFQSENMLYFVMTFCAGGAFFRMLQRQPGKRLSEGVAKFYAAEVLLALEYLHMLGFIYRDLKPENILLHASGHIMLTDFDLSKASAMPVTPKIVKQMFDKPAVHAKPSVVTNSFVGTEEYIAPEIINGYGHSSSVDWWTFGILMYEMIFGKTPFRGKTQDETFNNVLHRELKFPDNIPLSKEGRDFIRRLLRTDPRKRLGANHGAADLKSHAFFKGTNWALIRNETPPIIPELSSHVDCRYFRKYPPSESGIPDEVVDSEKSDSREKSGEGSEGKGKRVQERKKSPMRERGVNEKDLPEDDPFRKFRSTENKKTGY
mmetsp:Transcript_19707/g.55411  ORF Transcript_19707/g.55411 Transcript_19707/m.55411 type:complete len:402 (+) Transcript_19707:73-1278(+)